MGHGGRTGGECLCGMEGVDKWPGGEWEEDGPSWPSPFLRPSNTVRMPLFSGLQAFRGPRRLEKKNSLSFEVELVKFSKCGPQWMNGPLSLFIFYGSLVICCGVRSVFQN